MNNTNKSDTPSNASLHGDSDIDASFDAKAQIKTSDSAPKLNGDGPPAEPHQKPAKNDENKSVAADSPELPPASKAHLINDSKIMLENRKNSSNENETTNAKTIVNIVNGTLNKKPVAPPPPLPKPTTKTDDNHKTIINIELLSESIFDDVCDEVIKCDDRAPSVPDVILQVISEILAESNQTEDSNENEVANKSNISSKTQEVNNTSPKQPAVARIISNYQVEEEKSSSLSSPKKSPIVEKNGTSMTVINNNMNSMKLINSSPKTTNGSIKSNGTGNGVIGGVVSSNGAISSATSSTSSSPKINPTTLNNISTNKKSSPNSTVNASTNGSLLTPNKAAVDSAQKLNRNRTRKTITRTFVVDGQTVTQTKTVNSEEEERQRQLIEERKRDLIEHRRNLNEDRRKLIEQTKKQESEKEALEHDFKEQREKLLREFEIKLAQIHQFRKAEIERCEEAQAIELKSTLKRIRNEQDKGLKYQRDQLKEEFKLFKKELESNSNHMLMSKEHREVIKRQKEKELIKRVIRNIF